MAGKTSPLSAGICRRTKEADFRALYDTISGAKFVKGFQDIKGGGHITEIEGGKAADAIVDMRTAQTEGAFRAAGNRFIKILRAGLNVARIEAGYKELVFGSAETEDPLGLFE